MPSQEPQVQELIRTLTSLAGELEVLVDRTRSGNSGEDNPGLKFDSNISENDFNKHKALNTPVRLNVGNKVFLTTWKMLCQHQDTKGRPICYSGIDISDGLGGFQTDMTRYCG